MPFALGPLIGVAIGVSVSAWVVMVLFSLVAGEASCCRLCHDLLPEVVHLENGAPASHCAVCTSMLMAALSIVDTHVRSPRLGGQQGTVSRTSLRISQAQSRAAVQRAVPDGVCSSRAGLFIYVGSVGIVAEEFARHDDPAFAAARPKGARFHMYAALFFGFVVVALLQLVP